MIHLFSTYSARSVGGEVREVLHHLLIRLLQQTYVHVRVSHQCVFQFVVLCIALPSMPGLAKPSVACSMEKWVTLTRGESLGTMLVLL